MLGHKLAFAGPEQYFNQRPGRLQYFYLLGSHQALGSLSFVPLQNLPDNILEVADLLLFGNFFKQRDIFSLKVVNRHVEQPEFFHFAQLFEQLRRLLELFKSFFASGWIGRKERFILVHDACYRGLQHVLTNTAYLARVVLHKVKDCRMTQKQGVDINQLLAVITRLDDQLLRSQEGLLRKHLLEEAQPLGLKRFQRFFAGKVNFTCAVTELFCLGYHADAEKACFVHSAFLQAHQLGDEKLLLLASCCFYDSVDVERELVDHTFFAAHARYLVLFRNWQILKAFLGNSFEFEQILH